DMDSGATSDSVIKKHIIFSMGVGLIPVPIIDMVAITGVQLNMLRKLAEIYEVPFNDHKVKSTLSSLVGGGVTVPVARTLLSLTKMIPLAGQVIGFVTMPITAGATTFAVGKVFNQHFASGGTFLTFDSEKVRDYYTSMFEKGKDVATEMKDAAKDAATEMKDAAKDAATEMKDAAKDAATEMKDAAKDAATEMKDVAKDAATDMKD
ncbi:MAG: DUF697 domain-containing protein, partial [Candidatus Electrothrix sp. AX5]|nr:DUF697 domain-containing protein [Candidatus Electrothrix sp. AX5]